MRRENLAGYRQLEAPSDRSFGYVFALFFLLVAISPLLSGGPIRLWALMSTVLLLFISCAIPSLLSWPNKVWGAFGMLLHKIVNPVIMAVLFFAVITPFALVVRIFRRDPLCLQREPDAESYWVKREVNNYEKKSMKRQF